MIENVRMVVLAASSILFYGVFLIGLLVFGDHAVKALALSAAVLAALCQFVAQDSQRSFTIYRASIALAYASVAAAIAALWLFAV